MRTTQDKGKKTYSERMVSQSESNMKLKDSDRYVNKNVGDNLTKERTLSSQVRENNYFSDRHRNSGNSISDKSFYIDISAITGNNSKSGSLESSGLSDSVHMQNSRSNDVSDTTLGSNYEHNKVLSLENGMKLSDTERYVNSDVGGKKVQESILSEQVKDKVDFSSNIQNDVAGIREDFYATMPFSYGGTAKSNEKSEDVLHGSMYEQNKLLNVEHTLKVSNTNNYSNKNLISGKQKAMQLTDGIVDVKQAVIEEDSTGKYNSKKKSSSFEVAGIALSVLRPTIVKPPSIKKVRFSSTTVNLDNLSDKALLGKAVRSQQALNRSEIKYNKYKIKQLKKEKKSIGNDGKSKNVLGKSATAVRRSVDFTKNVTDGLQENTSGDDVLMEKSYALSGAVAVGAVNLTKGIVKKAVSVATLESKHKITSNREKKNLVKAQIKELKGVNKTIKNRSVDIQPTYGSAGGSSKVKRTIKQNTQKQKEIDKKLKLTQKEVNSKSKKDKKAKNKSDMKANRKAYIKDVTRKAVINNLVKPEADRENNLSTGFGGFVASIAKRFMDDFFKGLIKWFLGIIGHIIVIAASTLASMLVTLMPIMLPVAACVGVICCLFGALFGDLSTDQADENYCAVALNNIYNDFNKETHDWLVDGNKVSYVDDCSGVSNFQDTLLLYIIYSSDDVFSGDGDQAYLIVDTFTEKRAMQKAFDKLTYVEVDGNERKIHRRKLTDIENELTGNQKKLLELDRDLVADDYAADSYEVLGIREPGEYPDDIGVGSDLVASEKGQAAANYGCKFIGNKYLYGGTDINNGIDCSGFTQYVCNAYGVSLPRTAHEQVKCGVEVASLSEAMPGDLIFYSHDGTDEKVFHVTMYIGNNQMVHASNSNPYPRGGIKISNVYGSPYKIRRVFN